MNPQLIGITIGIQSPGESIWVNGIKQNAVFLAKLLMQLPSHPAVVLLNTTAPKHIESLTWNTSHFPTAQLDGFGDPLDLLIVLGGAISQEQVNSFRAKGTRLVSYKCGAEYVQSMEAALFAQPMGGKPSYPLGFDAIWVVPQIDKLCAHYYQTLHRAPVREVPFVWDPLFIDQACQDLPNKGLCQGGTGPRRISVFEPNLNVLKYCMLPLLIAEKQYRVAPASIELVSVLNTEKLRTSEEFVGVVAHLDLVRDQKAFFENRHATPWFLAHHTDVVVSHQWDNPLNYQYLETCWLGYPLVHNAALCPLLGFYYDGFDLQSGVQQLSLAMKVGDANSYRQRQRELVLPWMATNPQVLAKYAQLIGEL